MEPFPWDKLHALFSSVFMWYDDSGVGWCIWADHKRVVQEDCHYQINSYDGDEPTNLVALVEELVRAHHNYRVKCRHSCCVFKPKGFDAVCVGCGNTFQNYEGVSNCDDCTDQVHATT